MGSYKDALLNGLYCNECDKEMGGEVGYPRICKDCKEKYTKKVPKCDNCNWWDKVVGPAYTATLADGRLSKHQAAFLCSYKNMISREIGIDLPNHSPKWCPKRKYRIRDGNGN